MCMQLSAMDSLRLHLREHASESRDTPTWPLPPLQNPISVCHVRLGLAAESHGLMNGLTRHLQLDGGEQDPTCTHTQNTHTYTFFTKKTCTSAIAHARVFTSLSKINICLYKTHDSQVP